MTQSCYLLPQTHFLVTVHLEVPVTRSELCTETWEMVTVKAATSLPQSAFEG